MTAAKAAHDGLRVLDLSGGIAGQYCARLFADFGADVLLAEPPDGSPTRTLPPFAQGRAGPDRSFLFQHLSQGKSGVTLDRTTPQGAARLAELVREADVVIVDAADDIAAPDHAIVCVVSDFGTSGPYRHWTGSELIHQALSGVMSVTGAHDREPLYGVGHRASYACGVTAYISCLAALIWRDRTGEGQRVEAVTAEATAAMGQNLVTQYSYSQTYATRRQYPGMLAQLQCRDGWLVLFALRGWPAICKVFGVEDAATDPRFSDVVGLRRNWPQAVEILREKARGLAVDETVEALQNSKVSSERVVTLAELLAAEQFRGRGMWQAGDDGRLAALGPVFRTTSPTRTAPRPAPVLGADGAFALQPRRRTRSSLPPVADGSRLPLHGLKVVDFTVAWAGPMAARTLAFLGAEVTKIENASQLDSWRGPATGMSDPGAYPDRQAGDRPYDRQALFNTQNHDKRSISLNLKDARGCDLARRLIAESDVVLANFSPRALAKLGLGYDDLSPENPGLIVVEMPAFGNTGPWSSHVGMGKTMEAAAGHASLIGYGDGEPVLTGPAYFDPIGGLHGAAAVLTALAERDVTGRGQYVEVAQVEAALHWIGERILAAGAEGQSFPPDGNHLSTAAPHGAYPCQGDDQWVAISAPDDAAWRRLTEVPGLSPLAEARFATLAGRLALRQDVDAILGAWTAARNKHEAAEVLQGAGVAAAPVNSGADVFRDPFLRARSFIHELSHPDIGPREYAGLAYRLSRTPGAIRRPAPRFAEHTDEVLRGLGLSADDLAALEADKVVLRKPLAAG